MKNLEYHNSIPTASTENAVIVLKEFGDNGNLHRHLLESLPVAVYTCDKNGFIRFFNKAAADLWGKEPVIGKDQWCGSAEATTLDGTPLSASNSTIALAIKSGLIKRGEEIIITRHDGTTRVVMSHPQLITNEAGEISGALNVLTDVTLQKKSELALQESQIRYQQLLHGLPAAVYTCDEEGHIDMYNEAAEKLWGRKPLPGLDKWSGSWKIFQTDGTPIAHDQCPMARALKGETENNIQEIVVGREDGSQRVVLPHPKLIYDSTAKVRGAMNMLLDITEQKKAKQKIEDSEQRLSIAIETAQLGTWEFNVKTKEVFYSKRYLEILGYTAPVTLDHTQLLMHIHPSDIDLRNRKMLEGYETGSINYEMRILWTDQSLHWIKVQGKVFYDEDGKPDRMMGTIMDVTERKMAEEELEKRVQERTEELQQANLKLERSNHELEQYAYVASHDLQEPLRKIRTYSGMLHQELIQKYDKASTAVLQKVINSAERMSNLIYDLLNFSRLLKPDSIIEKTDLNTIIKNIISDFELALEQKKARIEVEQLPVIQAVPLQMNQLFYNLVNNALKFSRADVIPNIMIKTRILSKEEVSNNRNLNPQLAYIDVMVSDNGIGFDQNNAEHIFEVFKRLHTKDTYPGSGIGLALCRKITANHQGDIYAESIENEGSVFHAVLPIDLRRK